MTSDCCKVHFIPMTSHTTCDSHLYGISLTSSHLIFHAAVKRFASKPRPVELHHGFCKTLMASIRHWWLLQSRDGFSMALIAFSDTLWITYFLIREKTEVQCGSCQPGEVPSVITQTLSTRFSSHLTMTGPGIQADLLASYDSKWICKLWITYINHIEQGWNDIASRLKTTGNGPKEEKFNWFITKQPIIFAM